MWLKVRISLLRDTYRWRFDLKKKKKSFALVLKLEGFSNNIYYIELAIWENNTPCGMELQSPFGQVLRILSSLNCQFP